MSAEENNMTMPEQLKINLTRVGITVSIVLGLGSLLTGFFSYPVRLAAVESKITAMESEFRANRELLVRIDENVKIINKTRTQYSEVR